MIQLIQTKKIARDVRGLDYDEGHAAKARTLAGRVPFVELYFTFAISPGCE